MPDVVTTLARRTLVRHPQSPCAAVDEVAVEIAMEGDVVVVRYRIAGDLSRLRIPALGDALDPDRLWAHTCCEMFVAPATGERYVEWNFSPSGQIARFEFEAYRQPASSSSPSSAARSSVAIEPGAFLLHARAPLPPGIRDAARISLTTVVEDDAGALSYWALHHPRARADFHDRGGFALGLTLGASPAIVGP